MESFVVDAQMEIREFFSEVEYTVYSYLFEAARSTST